MEDGGVREDLALASLSSAECAWPIPGWARSMALRPRQARLSAPHGAVCAAGARRSGGSQPAGAAGASTQDIPRCSG